MRFELRHVRYVLAVAEQQSFRRAARSLSVEPSTISRRIRDLEDDIGAALFIRGPGGATLTVAGERFIERARKALNHLTQATIDVGSVAQGETGIVRLGLMSSMSSGFIDKLLKTYIADHAGVQMLYVEGEAADHIQAVQQCRMDVAFLIGMPTAEGCDIAHLWDERIYVAMSEQHELAGKSEVNWSDLRDQVFVVSEAQSGPEIHDYLVKNLARPGYRPSVGQHAVYRDTLMQIVAGGNSLTLTSEATIATQFPGVVYRLLAGEILPFCAVWSPRNDNPAFRRFLSLARVISKRCRSYVIGNGLSDPSSPVGCGLARGGLSQNHDPLR